MAIQPAGGKVSVHLSPSRHRLSFQIWICIQLGKKLLYRKQSGSHHKGLIAVVSTAPIAWFENLGHGYLGHFFTVAENAEFGLTGEHLPASE